MGTDEKTMNGVNPSNDDKGGGPGSVTLCVNALKAGDLAAAGPLWDRYFVELVRLARVRLARKRPQTLMSDEEDAALNALDSFYRGLALERFPKLDDREDLWRILVTITSRKVDDQIEHELALKRGGRMKRIQSFEEEEWVLTRLSQTTVTPEWSSFARRWASWVKRATTSPPRSWRSLNVAWIRSMMTFSGGSPFSSWRVTPRRRSPSSSGWRCEPSLASST